MRLGSVNNAQNDSPGSDRGRGTVGDGSARAGATHGIGVDPLVSQTGLEVGRRGAADRQREPGRDGVRAGGARAATVERAQLVVGTSGGPRRSANAGGAPESAAVAVRGQ